MSKTLLMRYTLIAIFFTVFVGIACKTDDAGEKPVITDGQTDDSNQDSDDQDGGQVKEPISYLALGDSYTIGESVTEKERWPVILAERLNAKGASLKNPKIIARTGWTTGNLLQKLVGEPQDIKYGLVSLLIGVNNQYQGQDIEVYKKEFETLLKKAITFANDDKARVFVLSIPDYSVTPFGGGSEKIAQEIDAYNEINKSITEAYGIDYYDITPISREAEEDRALIAEDGLHPSGKMYDQWVTKILNGVYERVKD